MGTRGSLRSRRDSSCQHGTINDVWSGFRDPALPVKERVLWRLTHSTSGQRADARVWVMDQGRQLRVTVDGELTFSHLFGPQDVSELPPCWTSAEKAWNGPAGRPIRRCHDAHGVNRHLCVTCGRPTRSATRVSLPEWLTRLSLSVRRTHPERVIPHRSGAVVGCGPRPPSHRYSCELHFAATPPRIIAPWALSQLEQVRIGIHRPMCRVRLDRDH